MFKTLFFALLFLQITSVFAIIYQEKDLLIDQYQVLGVEYNANETEIKSAYRKLSKIHHPDRHTGETNLREHELAFIKISTAYTILSDRETRQKLDWNLKIKPQPSQKYSPSAPQNNQWAQELEQQLHQWHNLDKKTHRTYVLIFNQVSHVQHFNFMRTLLGARIDAIFQTPQVMEQIIKIKTSEQVYLLQTLLNASQLQPEHIALMSQMNDEKQILLVKSMNRSRAAFSPNYLSIIGKLQNEAQVQTMHSVLKSSAQELLAAEKLLNILNISNDFQTRIIDDLLLNHAKLSDIFTDKVFNEILSVQNSSQAIDVYKSLQLELSPKPRTAAPKNNSLKDFCRRLFL